MVLLDPCLEGLISANLSWLLLSTIQGSDLSADQWQSYAGRCLEDQGSENVFYTSRFYPALYFGLDACKLTDTHFCETRQWLQGQGELRRLPSMRGGDVARELPDTLWLGLCAPLGCHENYKVLEFVLPALFQSIGNRISLNAFPPAGCCGRLLVRYWRSSENLAAIANVELRDRFYIPLKSGRFQERDYDCMTEFISGEGLFGQLFGAAMNPKFLRQHGSGRLWRVVREEEWEKIEHLTLRDYETCVDAGHKYVSVQVGDGISFSLSDHWGMCVPQLCTGESVFNTIVRPFLRNGESSIITEVKPWGAMPVNFVVAGFAKCGTSTLAATLNKHPHIAMSHCSKDEACEHAIWSAVHRHDFLLVASDLLEVDAQFGDTDKNDPTKRGVKDSRVLEEDASISKMSKIPGIKVIVVIRDPIEALESHYNAMECWKVRSLHEMAELGLTDCLTDRGWGTWSARLKKLQSMLPDGLNSMFILHLSTMNTDKLLQSSTFRAMLSFIGLPLESFPISDTSSFSMETRNQRSRSHSKDSHLIDICTPENRATLELLKIRYADEYSRLESMLKASGAEVPADFAARRTRCDISAIEPMRSF